MKSTFASYKGYNPLPVMAIRLRADGGQMTGLLMKNPVYNRCIKKRTGALFFHIIFPHLNYPGSLPESQLFNRH